VHFGFDDDQIAVRDAVAGLLDKRAGLATLQQAWSDPTADEAWAVWPELAGMGVHGILAPEASGGSAMGWVAMTLVLAEAGRVALPLPLLETAAVAVPLLAAAGDPDGLLPGLVDGTVVVSAAGGPGAPVPSASRADWFLVDGALHRRDRVRITPVPSVDRARDTALVEATGPGTTVGDAGDVGALASAAVLVGLGRALVQMTVEYVRDRKQFGVPVGSFQAVKHHLADATMHVEFAAPAVWAAAWEMDHAGEVAPWRVSRSVSLAKALAADGAQLAARTALQCHGAMGYTDDYHLHMWLKRVWCLAPAYGSALEHRRRVGAHLGVAR
jgi:alkylation response protein AidB-like acyl-CoA dehydrogenase